MRLRVLTGYIFDIEGTLIDCIPQNLRSWQETLASFGMTVSLDVTCSLIPGWTAAICCRSLRFGYG